MSVYFIMKLQPCISTLIEKSHFAGTLSFHIGARSCGQPSFWRNPASISDGPLPTQPRSRNIDATSKI